MSTIIGTRKAQLKVDGVDYTAEVSRIILTSGDTESEFVSFEDALTGGARDYKLKLRIRQDTDTASLWYVLWDQAGEDLEYEFWPAGGMDGSPSTDTPEFSGTVTIMEPDGDFLGGDADKSPRKVQVVEVEWPCTDKPTMTTT
jgi:hypothetical protein